MAINSVSEFEAVLSQAQIKIQKAIVQRGEIPALKKALRMLEKIEALAREPEKLKPLRDDLEATGEVLRREIGHDEKLRNDTWDLTDYIDFRC